MALNRITRAMQQKNVFLTAPPAAVARPDLSRGRNLRGTLSLQLVPRRGQIQC